MGRIYTVGFEGVTVNSNGQDLIEILVPSNGLIEVLRCWVSQSSDYGDAEAAGFQYEIARGASGGTTGTGGSTPTPARHLAGDAASTCTTKANNTTRWSGTKTKVVVEAAHNQAGYVWVPTPKEVIRIKGGDFFLFGINTDLSSDAHTMSGGVTFEELW